MVIGRFGKDERKILLMELFFSKFSGCGHNSMPKPPIYYKQQLCRHIYQRSTQITSSFKKFFYSFFSPVGPSIWVEIANNRSTILLEDFIVFGYYAKISFRKGRGGGGVGWGGVEDLYKFPNYVKFSA